MKCSALYSDSDRRNRKKKLSDMYIVFNDVVSFVDQKCKAKHSLGMAKCIQNVEESLLNL